jgi:hypothetical protein
VKIRWVGSLILWSPMLIAGRTESNQFGLTLCEYNLANIPEARLATVHQEVQRIFKQIGVAVRWEQTDSSNPEAYQTDRSIPTPSTLTLPAPNRIVMRIVLNKKGQFAGGDMGKSLPFAPKGVQVTIVSDNIERVADKTEVPLETLFAYVMVHEIVHVLLRSTGHSFGIMRASWTRWDYEQIGFGILGFTAADKVALRRATQDWSRPNLVERASESIECGL